VEIAPRDNAGDGSGEAGVLLQIGDLSASDLNLGMELVILLLRHTAEGTQGIETSEVTFERKELRTRGKKLGLIHLNEQLPCGDNIANVDQYSINAPSNGGTDVIDLEGIDGSRESLRVFYASRGNKRDTHV